MSCTSDITSNIDGRCKTSLGGTSAVYLFNYIENPFTIEGGLATALDGLDDGTVYKYELNGDGNTLEEVLTGDRNTGTSVNVQTVTVLLKKISATNTAQFNLLVKGFPMAVVKDRNGVYHAIGIDDGIDFVATGSIGGEKTGMNGTTLVGTSTTGELSPKLNPGTITAFEGLVTE